jgi:uroporphyrinogen-III decarboxylase
MDVAAGESDELVHQLLKYCAEVTCQFIKLMARTGAHMLSNGDSPAGPDMLSPRLYSSYALPYERLVAECSHQKELPYLLQICGKTDRILNQMLDTGAVLALGTPELVKNKTDELLDTFSDTPRFILNCGCALPANTPPENIYAMLSCRRTLSDGEHARVNVNPGFRRRSA